MERRPLSNLREQGKEMNPIKHWVEEQLEQQRPVPFRKHLQAPELELLEVPGSFGRKTDGEIARRRSGEGVHVVIRVFKQGWLGFATVIVAGVMIEEGGAYPSAHKGRVL